MLRIPQSSSITVTHHQIVYCHIQDTCWSEEVLPLCRGAVGLFYSPSWLGKYMYVCIYIYIYIYIFVDWMESLFILLVNIFIFIGFIIVVHLVTIKRFDICLLMLTNKINSVLLHPVKHISNFIYMYECVGIYIYVWVWYMFVNVNQQNKQCTTPSSQQTNIYQTFLL